MPDTIDLIRDAPSLHETLVLCALVGREWTEESLRAHTWHLPQSPAATWRPVVVCRWQDEQIVKMLADLERLVERGYVERMTLRSGAALWRLTHDVAGQIANGMLMGCTAEEFADAPSWAREWVRDA